MKITVRCLLDYDHVKNYYRLIAIDFSRQKVLDADPKAIQQIEFVGKLRKQMLIIIIIIIIIMMNLRLF